MKNTILAINPGSTSTKIAIFEGSQQKYQTNLTHSAEELEVYPNIASQFEFRRQAIKENLIENGIKLEDIEVVIGRGGLIYPLESGTYGVNDLMKEHLHNPPLGEHASNLGGLIADDIAREITELSGSEVRAYIADPVVVDEMQEVAKVSGHPLFRRLSIFHALNQKAIARAYAADNGKKYEDLNLVVVHLGGGISVGAHCKGKVIDVNNALDGEGPMSPERSGTLPVGQLVKLCFSGKYTQKEVAQIVKGQGGMVGFTGSNDARVVCQNAEDGEPNAKLVVDAMCYQISKYIGEMAVVLKGKVDAIILTGGMARDKMMTADISEMTSWIAPIAIYGGEDEMEALALNAYRVLVGELEAKTYCGKAE